MVGLNVSQSGGTFLDKIVDVLIPPQIVLFLNTTLIRQPFFILNYWSFLHLLVGVGFGLLFPKRFKLWVYLNVIFEVSEFLLALGGNPLFVEEAVDITWDIFWSLIGFVIITWNRVDFKKEILGLWPIRKLIKYKR